MLLDPGRRAGARAGRGRLVVPGTRRRLRPGRRRRRGASQPSADARAGSRGRRRRRRARLGRAPETAPPNEDVDGDQVSYDASNMLDGVPETAWRAPGDGQGMELDLHASRADELTPGGADQRLRQDLHRRARAAPSTGTSATAASRPSSGSSTTGPRSARSSTRPATCSRSTSTRSTGQGRAPARRRSASPGEGRAAPRLHRDQRGVAGRAARVLSRRSQPGQHRRRPLGVLAGRRRGG